MDALEQPDLLPHKYRPNCVAKVTNCHIGQAQLLKQWILDFTSKPNRLDSESEESDISRGSNNSANKFHILKKCVLITGPPGVGKTSLVYTVANELKLHVVESHSSERRDFKLFSALKLANQKGKINPIAKLFQAAKQKQSDIRETRRKRRKLAEFTNGDNFDDGKQKNHCLSLSGDSSIVLFDDIDVVFEEDGPFLKSLVEFIHESKRPVILTATQSIDYIKAIIIHLEHINLERPLVEECTQLLSSICTKENYCKSIKSLEKCRVIADSLNCDIRQCLNKIHFYGNKLGDSLDCDNLRLRFRQIEPEFTSLKLNANTSDLIETVGLQDDDDTILYYDKGRVSTEVSNQSTEDKKYEILGSKEFMDRNSAILDCYNITSWIDLMDSRFHHISRKQSLTNWLERRPAPINEIYDFNQDLNEQIRCSMIELAQRIYPNDLMTQEAQNLCSGRDELVRINSSRITDLMNHKIKGRIEPPDKEFYTEIVPMLGEMIALEGSRRFVGNLHPSNNAALSGNHNLSPFASSRRSRRIPSYLESISIYFEPEDFNLVSKALLDAERTFPSSSD